MTKPDFDVLSMPEILRVCRQSVSSSEIFASCAYGPRVYGHFDDRAKINLLLVLRTYAPKMRHFAKRFDDVRISILAMTSEAFESDVEVGQFGEIVAEIIALPYRPLANANYLEEMEVKLKRRFVLELLRNVIWQYPELSNEVLIEPEYFMYETFRRRLRLLPTLTYSFVQVFQETVRKRNMDSIMHGYHKAIGILETENTVISSNSHVRIDREFVKDVKRQHNKFSKLLQPLQRSLKSYARSLSLRVASGATPQSFILNNEQRKVQDSFMMELEEAEKHLLMPTPEGPVPLSNKTSIQDFARKTPLGKEASVMEIEQIGGVLNSVFLLTLRRDNQTKKIVAKKFEDWQGFKWLPLALWTLGTQSFAVLGKTRLEREYSTNQLMSKHCFKVPRILHVSLKERLIFEEFVQGKKLDEVVKEIISRSSREDKTIESEIIRRAGKEVARAHSLNIALGDCKPENMLFTEDKQVCFLDLEQATRNGNRPWDIAEFLYYSGHYLLPIHSDKAAKTITSSFLEGYIEGGGQRESVREAASAKYTKVFSVFTLPHVLLAIARICRKMSEGKRD